LSRICFFGIILRLSVPQLTVFAVLFRDKLLVTSLPDDSAAVKHGESYSIVIFPI